MSEDKKQQKKKAPKAEEEAATNVDTKTKEVATPTTKKKNSKKKKEAGKTLVVRGKRKSSVARATISSGKGVLRFNKLNVEAIQNKFVREIIKEPLRYVGAEATTVDIDVSARGGGALGQAQAARTAIANALDQYFDGMNLKAKFVEIDRSLIVEDTRRVESKKFRGPKARARFQKSYR